ncbi:MAG: HesB/IscA family protein [Magnetospiraceae bacterium]
MLTLTEAAQTAIAQFINGADKPYTGLRVGVNGGGCSGYTYSMALEESPTEDDLVISCGSATVYLDPESAPLLDGTVIDFTTGLEGSGFKFENPKAASQCGCGKSFSSSCA